MPFDVGHRSVLSPYDLHRFAGDTLFDRIARAVCEADCLPRKELYESWHVARRVRRRLRGGRVVDLACGHGLTAWLLLLLDRESSCAVAIDRQLPPSAHKLFDNFSRAWPALAARVQLRASELDEFPLEPTDLVVATHACGALTDLVLQRAAAARANVAVLPCCHDVERCDLGGLTGWLDPALAIDVTRAARLRQRGYRVHTTSIPAEITPKNRLLIGEPSEVGEQSAIDP